MRTSVPDVTPRTSEFECRRAQFPDARELLAAILNLADGGVDYHQIVVDSDGDGTADTTFADAVATAEAVRLDPDSTRAEIDEQRRLIHQINQFAE